MVERNCELDARWACRKSFVTENERDTVIVKQQCVRASCELYVGERIEQYDVDVLGPLRMAQS